MGAHVRLAGPDYDEHVALNPQEEEEAPLFYYKDDPHETRGPSAAVSSTKFTRSRASNRSSPINISMETSPTCGTTCIN